MSLTQQFTYSGGVQSWTVPQGCTSATFTVDAAGGGGATGGAGERVIATIAVTPGDVYNLWVGGAGKSHLSDGTGGAGGWPNGGAGGNALGGGGAQGGYGGGGASIVRRVSGSTLVDIIYSGAGGGADGSGLGTGGDGGTLVGASGTPTSPPDDSRMGIGGGGGNSTPGVDTGGAAGTSGGALSNTATAGDSTAGVHGGPGGHGSSHTASNARAGGGGGGGYRSGGGGGGGYVGYTGGGGGGGSDYWLNTATGVTRTRGGGAAARRDGAISITYTLAPAPPPLIQPQDGSSIDVTLAQQFVFQYSCADPSQPITTAQIRYRVGSGAWTTIAAFTPTPVGTSSPSFYYYTFAAHTFDSYLNQTIEWQALTNNAAGVGAWSASSYVKIAPTTPPFAGTATISSKTPRITGARTDSGPIGQYQAEVWSDVAGAPGVRLATSGIVTVRPSVTSLAVLAPSYNYVNGTTYHLLVTVWDPNGISQVGATDLGAMVANVDAPLQPSLAVAAVPDTASVVLTPTNPGSDPHPPDWNDFYRLDTWTDEETRIATGVVPGTQITDWTAGFNRGYQYRVDAVRATGAHSSSA